MICATPSTYQKPSTNPIPKRNSNTNPNAIPFLTLHFPAASRNSS